MCNNEHLNKEENKLDWHCLQHGNIKDCMEECKVQEVLNLFGKKYVMPIIRLLLIHNKLRFNEILGFLKGSPKTITSRLRNLECSGLIKRRVFNEIPMRVEYSLTEKGTSLEDVFERFARWALTSNY
jgi:DNA-binding HxlR family transcriptional regulator